MPLVDAVNAPSDPRPSAGLPCSVGLWLDSLSATERDAALVIIAGRARWSHANAFELFRAEGYSGGLYMVGHHRRGHCRCDTR